LNSSTLAFNNLSIANSSTATTGSSFQINGVLTIGSSSVFVPSGGVITFNNGSSIVNNGTLTFSDISIANSSTVTTSSSFSIGGAFTIGNSGNFSPSAGTVTMNHGSSISNSGTLTFNNLTIAGSAVVTTSSSFSINNAISVGSGGNFSPSGGTISVNNGSTISNSGTLRFNNLTVVSSASVNATNSFVVNGTFTINTGGIFSPSAAVVISGSTGTITGSGTVYVSRIAASPEFNSQYTINTKTLTNLNVEYVGIGAQTISSRTYGSLTVNNSNGVVLAGTTTVTGTLTLTSGTMTVGNKSLTIQSAIGGTPTNLSMDNTSSLTISGTGSGVIIPNSVTDLNSLTISNTSGASLQGPLSVVNTVTLSGGTFADNGNTLTANGNVSNSVTHSGTGKILLSGGSSSHTLSGNGTYGNLELNDANGASTSADITINGTLTLTAGTFADGGFTITAKGNISNGTSHSGTGKILLSGSASGHTLSGTGTFTNMELNDANGVTLSSNTTVNGTLTLSSGKITTGSNKLILSSSGTLSRTSGHIVGNLQKNIPVGTPSLTFEIGDAGAYTPIDINFASVSTSGNLIASTTSGDHSDISNSGILSTKSVNRYWTISNSGTVFTTYDATFNFVSGDIDAGANTDSFIVRKFSGSWSSLTTGAKAATSTDALGLSSFSDFQIGQAADNPVPVLTSISPTTKNVGDNAFTLTLNGSSFVPNSIAKFNGTSLTTTFVNSSQITAQVSASNLINPASVNITVFSPAPAGGTSSAQVLTIVGGSISGTKFEDTDGNGVKDVGESGLSNWKIKINGASTDSQLTDGSGNYSFTNLPSGSYIVSEVSQNGWSQTLPSAPGTYSLTVAGASISYSEKNFGNFYLGSISGLVFNDLNGDSIKQGGESGVSVWKIKITGPRVDSVLSDGSGNYSFGNLPVGTYTVSEVLQAGWIETYPASQTYSLVITSGSTYLNKNFGNFQQPGINGIVFDDVNGNSVKDPGESGLQNWKIKITGTATDSVLSNSDGTYAFSNLAAGTYTISEVLQNGWIVTLPANPYTYTVSLQSSQNATGKDFGNFLPGSISGKIFNDANGNGVKDVGEAGLQNWKARITGTKTDSALSDVNGNYTFSSLTVGSYTVSENAQLGWSQTLPALSGNYSVNITSGLNATNKDFGNAQYGSITGQKFNDLNGNGVKDVGEGGLQNWRIRLGGTRTDSILTDVNGNYSFALLTSGSYTVSEDQQTGWIRTLPVSPSFYSITITSGETFSSQDFGNFQYGSISGQKFNDINGNGIKDPGESGLSNWRIRMAGTITDSMLTDGSGNYSFTNLTAGTYILSEGQQNGWIQTKPISPTTYTVSITSGSNLTGKDFGNFQLGSIAGEKFNDINGNGTKDVGESGLQNWRISLSGPITDSTLTDVNGNYSFSSLTVGSYTVSEKLQTGWIQTMPSNPGTYVVSISSGVNSTDKDFGNFQLGSIAGINFNDVDGNGVKDVGETGLQNWKMKLSGAKTDSILTDANGNYSFTSLTLGSYTISEVLQSGWLQSLPASNGSYSVSITSGTTSTGKDFGNFQLGSISGQKFNDVDGDGVKDIGELGLSGWKIRLSGTKTDSALTDASGNYSFTNLTAGSYTLTEVNQSGWLQTFPTNPSTYTISVSSGTVSTGKDFGNFQLGTISGKKFNDLNGNATKDNGEVGLQNWKIKISGAKTDSVLTDVNGNYTFSGLTVGSYTISEVQQSGWVQMLPTSNGTYSVPVTSGTNASGKDFGNFQLGSISGLKFEDVNGNGVKDGGESSLSGWTVYLYKNDTTVIFDSTVSTNTGFTFSNLSVGTYYLREVLQTGWIQTTTNPAPINVTSGLLTSNVNFGNFHLGSISGLKINDINGNGTRDFGENGLPNWKIKISGAKTDSVLTDANGNYSFTNLLGGIYTVSEIQQTGWLQTIPSSPGTYSLTVTSGSNLIDKNFGNFQLGSISGNAFYDVNGNGIKDIGDTGLVNWRVRLSGSRNDSALTDASGNYSFVNLLPGNYIITEAGKAGWSQTTPASSGSYSLSIASGQNVSGEDFGNFELIGISGTIFSDINGNGVQDSTDGLLSNWRIRISGAKTDSTLTDANGNYVFTNLPNGTINVSEVVQPGWTQTFPSSSTYTLNVVSGVNVTGKDFGNFGGNKKFRTIRSETDLSLKGVKMSFDKKTNALKTPPTIASVLENIFVSIGKSGTSFLGIPQATKDSAKKYAWIFYKKAAELGKLYTDVHNGQARPLDQITTSTGSVKKLSKAIKAARKTFDNRAFEQGVLFNLNLIGSSYGVLPQGYDSLILDTTASLAGRSLRGYSLKSVGVYLDSVMTYWKRFGVDNGDAYSDLDEFIRKIIKPLNERFATTFSATDTSLFSLDTNAVKGLTVKNQYAIKLKGIKTASEAGGLVRQSPTARYVPSFTPNSGYIEIPREFNVEQNYPNPFNPTTSIMIKLSEQSSVSLKVYNILGEEVATILNNNVLEQGEVEVQFDASKLSSGVYFYRTTINHGEYVFVRKMVLMK